LPSSPKKITRKAFALTPKRISGCLLAVTAAGLYPASLAQKPAAVFCASEEVIDATAAGGQLLI